jgi:4-hydroxy-3-polyprenylbenzoate decarboxylase
MLKEQRPLVLVPRETPFSLVHLANLTALAEAGAVVVPASPAFYGQPSGIDDLVDFVVGKVLDQIGVEHRLYRRGDE